MGYEIREMEPAHFAGRGHVQYACWRETYRGLMPDAYLDSFTLEDRIRVAREHPEDTLVALAGERVVGFACYARQAREFVHREDASEIAALYVLGEYQGRGIGRALLLACLQRLPHRQVALFVLEGNDNALAFYAHMGFHPTGKVRREETGFGTITELEMLLERGPGDLAANAVDNPT